MEENRTLMLLDVRTDKLTMMNYEPAPSNDIAESLVMIPPNQ